MRIGADFKGMEISDSADGDFVEFTMDNQRDYIMVDKDDAKAIIQHLTEQFDLDEVESEDSRFIRGELVKLSAEEKEWLHEALQKSTNLIARGRLKL